MDEYSGRLLAERYRLPRPPSDEYELRESVAYDTASGQEVLVRQVPLPEVVEAEVLGQARGGQPLGRATRRPADPAVRRAVEAAQAASRIPDHPRLDQVFDVFVEDLPQPGLWIASELVAARPLAAVLAEQSLSPHRAAEIAADLLAALSAVHTFGWTHRNITARSVLICDDGRALLTGLASGAAEEALCGYDPLPTEGPMAPEPTAPPQPRENGVPAPRTGRAAIAHRAARSGAIAAYRAGAAAARVAEEERALRAPWGGDKPGPAAAIPAQQTASAVPALPEPDADPGLGPEPDSDSLGPKSSQEPIVQWGAQEPAEDGRYRGPITALAAERSRQARMTIVGAVTERWAPEQAGPVYENWRLAPPVGPAADLWAVGALLFRAVQGHAPYPEDNAAELTQMVCAEPPAFAEECGPLRPVIESLLRQDPTERPEFEELSGWLRSLIRSAPEPEVGRRTVTAQPALEPGERRADPRRLPIVRRRGELVRRRRSERRPVHVEQRRHRRGRERERSHSPRRLGLMLLGLVLLVLTAGVVYAVALMPKTESSDGAGNRRSSVGGAPSEAVPPTASAGEPAQPAPSKERGSRTSQSTEPAQAPDGYTLRDDPAGFQIAVPEGWSRGQTSGGQVRYSKGDLEMIIVPGRDSTDKYGSDPREYQLADEPELDDYRDSNGWKTVSGVRTITVGETAMAEGEFGWDGSGGKVVLRNRAMLLGDKYHVVLVKGPESERKAIDEHFPQIADTYRATG